ncbi:FHA domain-containing protein [Lipingzhangella sp. LS1_29]|uniref:FHA domain-containing protein n=1 Tax=Lipingzhangella rawalii TaxID=2055835 RepID=A0ABU2H0G4_9ACTN|nr:FHA domain-containing protein [Lipingzhangella rawalii]MDS1268791.1 FHA domain-containing protein [Lipingzhangella rawalii]
MAPQILGNDGDHHGQRFQLDELPITFGRSSDNTVVVDSRQASRHHASVAREGEDYVLSDLGSRNGTLVNGQPVETCQLRTGDLITVGEETFRFENLDPNETVTAHPVQSHNREAVEVPPARVRDNAPVLRVTVSGGGPVGLGFALLLEHLMGDRVAITVYDERWVNEGTRVVWQDERHGNVRRQQVVTIQSRQFRALPQHVQEHVFQKGTYSEMWPTGPDSVEGYGPRNVRIAHVENALLELANARPQNIRLVPRRFHPQEQAADLGGEHVLAICEGARSPTREYFRENFGKAEESIYSLNGEHVQDVVLGLRVASSLNDPMTVLLTVAQNRFLLNSLHGEGFLNMRLTAQEAREAVGIDPARQVFEDCIASRPCVLVRDEHENFHCPTHSSLFLPALVRGSALWDRVREGLRLFGVADDQLAAITAFRLGMVQRPRFTAQLLPATVDTPSTYGFLLGDAANAIHFWPGRGLNSGFASAVSLSRALATSWSGRPLRDADFVRHEAAMSMLQYRHKSRAFTAMVDTDEHGVSQPIAARIATAQDTTPDRDSDLETFLDRLRGIRDRLASRMPGMPDDATLRKHLRGIGDETLHTLVASGPWDTAAMAGEEVDVEMFHRPSTPPSSTAKSGTAPTPAGIS